MFNSILRYTQQIFFSITLSAMLSLKNSYQHGYDLMNLSFSIFALIALVAFSFFVLIFMEKNKGKLSKPEFMAKYGALYVTVEYDSHKEALKYGWYFCIRRLAFAAIIVFLSDFLVL